MSKLTKLQAKLDETNLKNWSFADFQYILTKTGWELRKGEGSHEIYTHPDYSERVNIQNKNGEAKIYQIKQYLKIIGDEKPSKKSKP